MKLRMAAAATAGMLVAAGGAAAPAAAVPPGHLIIVFMENLGYPGAKGNVNLPYLNSLWNEGASGTGPVIDYSQYYAVTHASARNYLAFASGDPQIPAGDDAVTPGQIAAPNVWDQLTAAGVSWGVFEEGLLLPNGGTCSARLSEDDPVSQGRYVVSHNPATPFASVGGNGGDGTLFNGNLAECDNVTGLQNMNLSALPAVSFVTPNLCDDMHGFATGSAGAALYGSSCISYTNALYQRADSWLASHVPAWTAAGATVLITFDEGGNNAGPGGATSGWGGHLLTLLTGPGLTPRTDAGSYTHYSVLAAIEDAYGLSLLGGAAAANPIPLN